MSNRHFAFVLVDNKADIKELSATRAFAVDDSLRTQIC